MVLIEVKQEWVYSTEGIAVNFRPKLEELYDRRMLICLADTMTLVLSKIAVFVCLGLMDNMKRRQAIVK